MELDDLILLICKSVGLEEDAIGNADPLAALQERDVIDADKFFILTVLF